MNDYKDVRTVAQKEKSKAFELTREDCDFAIKGTEDALIFELSRKDGKPLGEKEIIPRGLYESWRSIIMVELAKEKSFNGQGFSIEHKFSDDRYKFIMTIVPRKQTFQKEGFARKLLNLLENKK